MRKLRNLAIGISVAAAAVGALVFAYPAQAMPSPPDDVQATSVMDKVVHYAKSIKEGHKEKGWHGGKVPYSWGGGHASKPHPTLGTCEGYTGEIQPCPADHTKGVDCSGFARWVYSLAFGRDVFGGGPTNAQIANRHMHKVKHPKPGDLAFYGSSTSKTHHVGIYIGHGKMINARKTGHHVETDSVHVLPDLLGYYHYSR